jgi:asparagine synthase (glutamine-hydrolysing)
MSRHYTALLLHYEDANNAGFGMESRFPFLDHRLVEFLFGLPRDQKVRGARAKIVLRNGMTGVLPDSVRNRVDKGFIDRPVDQWLAHQYTESVQARMFGKRLAETGWVDQKRLREHYEQYRVTHAGRVIVWKCFNLGLWLEEFF